MALAMSSLEMAYRAGEPNEGTARDDRHPQACRGSR